MGNEHWQCVLVGKVTVRLASHWSCITVHWTMYDKMFQNHGLETEWDYSGRMGRDGKARKQMNQVRKRKREK